MQKIDTKPIKAVIFDMDGVLADTIPVHLKSWQKIFRDYYKIRLTKKYFFKYLNARQGPDTISLVTGLNIPYSQRVKISEKKDEYSKKFLQHIKPTPGLINLLKFLQKNKIKAGVATSAQPAMMHFLLNKLRIKKYFQYIVTAKDIKKGKPDPDCYLRVAKNLKVQSQQAIIIEDAPLGLLAGKRGKFFKTIGITNTQPAKDLKLADLIINDFNNKKLYQLLKPETILASASPARKKLLKKYINDFSIVASKINERRIKIKNPNKLAIKLAELKAEKIAKKYPHAIIIAADTLGAIKNKIYGKPLTKKNYLHFAKDYSNNKISVITGFCIIDGINNNKYINSETSWIYFNKLSKQQIENYYQKYHPLYKGGGFNIEEIEKLGFVKKIIGDYDNIIGLPKKTMKYLRSFDRECDISPVA